MSKWKAANINGGWYVVKTDFLGKVTQSHGGDCGTKEKAQMMAQQYNKGY